MATRKRMTWGAGRKASSPPATPGYDVEDQDHPAHQEDPAYAKYKEGDPDAWAETPNPPPYPEGNPPADPGYDVEDQDHPAHEPNPRVPKEASLRVLVERKAAKCSRIAQAMLGKKASLDQIEDQSLSLMDFPDEEIDATLARMSGGFVMAEDEDEESVEEGMLADMLDEDVIPEDDDVEEAMLAEMIEESEVEVDDGPMAMILATMKDLKAEVMALKQANQNDPNGKTLGASGESAEQVQAEAEATTKDEVPSDQKTAEEDPGMAAMFDAYDTDGDGFITTADWKGPRAMFASLDTDGDGILARSEVVATCVADEDEIIEDEDEALLAAMLRQAAETDEDGKEAEESESDEAKTAADDDESSEPETAGKKAGEVPEALKPFVKKKDEDKDDKDDESEDKAEDKKACGEAAMFTDVGDSMGLAEGEDEFLPEDEALLAEIFNGKEAADDDADEESESDEAKTAADDDDGEAEESESDKEGSKKARVTAARKAMRLAQAALKAAEDDKEADEEEVAKVAADEDESEKKEARMKAAKKQAALRPQPRKPNPGIKSVGGMNRTAGARNEVGELESLWESAPDVSEVFGK